MSSKAIRSGLIFGSVAGFIMLISVIVSIIILTAVPHDCEDVVDESIETIIGDDENEESS